ncbi:STAS domain-containing protein [Candidatus Aerophobetes bacterium]|nr:STAS domain-containing protein [Candidatus Aerophobetes bacterium]
MEVTIKKIDDIPVIFLKGRFDGLGAGELEKKLPHPELKDAKAIVLDFEHVDYLSSAGIRVILELHKTLIKRGRNLILTSLSSFPLEVLGITGFTEIFTIKSKLKEALDELIEMREKTQICATWEKLPAYKKRGALFTLLPGNDASTWIELSGNISDVLQGRCTPENVISTFFSGNEYAVSIGSVGKYNPDCVRTIDQMVILKKMIAWISLQNPALPDFLMLKKDEEKIPAYTIFQMELKGKFNHVIAVEAEDKKKGIRLDELQRAIFSICKEHYPDFKGVVGVVVLANCEELYSLRANRLAFDALTHKDVGKGFSQEIGYVSQDKPQHRQVDAVMVGAGVNLENDLSCYDADALRSLFNMHASYEERKDILFQNHSLILPRQNFSVKHGALEDTISSILLAVAEEGKILDVTSLSSETTITKALVGVFLVDGVYRKEEKYLQVSVQGEAPPLSLNHSLIARKLFRDCKQLKLYALGGGFSGSRVFRVASWDRKGRKQMPMVMKIGSLDEITREMEAFEKFVKKFILNNATHLVSSVLQGEDGGLVYNFVGLSGQDTQIFSLDEFYRSHSTDDVLPILETLFRNILKLWYRQPIYTDLHLYQEYDFFGKLPLVSSFAQKELSVGDSQEWVTFPEIQGKFINPLYVVKNSFPQRLSKEFPSYRVIVHGDMNLRNILLDEKRNVWIIDFSETHEGHILKDLAKLEATIKFESFDIRGWDELAEMIAFEKELLKPEKFDQLPHIDFPLKNPWLEKIYKMVRKVREFTNLVTFLEEDIRQYYLALFYFTLQVVRYAQLSEFTKLYALISSSLICEKL